MVNNIERMESKDALEILAQQAVGRIAWHDFSRVELLPVNFAMDGREIFVRTTPTSVLAALAHREQEVAFEVDSIDNLTEVGWNVTAHGTSFVANGDRVEGLKKRPRPWVHAEQKHFYLGIRLHEVQGRRVVVAPDSTHHGLTPPPPAGRFRKFR